MVQVDQKFSIKINGEEFVTQISMIIQQMQFVNNLDMHQEKLQGSQVNLMHANMENKIIVKKTQKWFQTVLNVQDQNKKLVTVVE